MATSTKIFGKSEDRNLVVRAHDVAQIAELQKLAYEPEIYTFFDNVAICPHNDERAALFKQRLEEQQAGRRDILNGAVELDGKLVGDLMLLEVKEGHMAEVAYWVAKPYWGQGIATEAIRLFTDFAFKEYNLIRIYAYVRLENIASMAILRANGFEQEGRLRKTFDWNGEFFDEEIYAKMRI